MEYNGKYLKNYCRQNTAGIKQMGRPNANSHAKALCVCFIFLSIFCSSICNQKIEKGSGREKKRREIGRERWENLENDFF